MPLRILAAQSAIQDELKLTPEQRDQIARATDVNAFTQGMDDRVRAILSAEQQSRAKQLELQQLTADAALVRDDVVKALKLTDDQLAAVRKMAEETALKSRSAMSEAFSGQGVDRSTFAAKMAELAKERDEQILTVLSAEQREGWHRRWGQAARGSARLPMEPLELPCVLRPPC